MYGGSILFQPKFFEELSQPYHDFSGFRMHPILQFWGDHFCKETNRYIETVPNYMKLTVFALRLKSTFSPQLVFLYLFIGPNLLDPGISVYILAPRLRKDRCYVKSWILFFGCSKNAFKLLPPYGKANKARSCGLV